MDWIYDIHGVMMGMEMQTTKNLFLLALLGIGSIGTVAAKSVTWCVYDMAGNSGDVMQAMKDYALAAKNWGVETKTKVYTSDQQAVDAFKNNTCDAVVASSFVTREFNSFMGTLGAVGLIPNHQVANQLFMNLDNASLKSHMTQNNYEAVGWMPIGPAYFMVRDRSLNSITELAGRKVGVLKSDPSQERMARRVGAVPVFMAFENAGQRFIQREIDVLASPVYAYQPLELHRGLGNRGGVINFPVAYISLVMITKQKEFPSGYGQKSREWFKARTPKMMQNVIQWEKTMPNKYWYDIPMADRTSYQRLVAQLRKEFIKSGVYDNKMIDLVLKIHCAQNEKYFECKK